MNQALVLNNDSVVQIGWAYEDPIPGCLGFAIYRIDKTSQPFTKVPLPAWVGFAGDKNPWSLKTTEEWPVQKFSWRDTTVKLHGTYQYQIVPMVGTPGNLKPQVNSSLFTTSINVNPRCGIYTAAFNKGMLANQSLGPGKSPDFQNLLDKVEDPKSPLRAKLAGNVPRLLVDMLDQARDEGGKCYLALYELNDPQLVDRLVEGAAYVNIILSNAGDNDYLNADARTKLKAAGVNVIDRILPPGHLGHNKFMVYVDKAEIPRAVLTGSTNWSTTGLCTQSNNVLIADSTQLAGEFMDYWKRLKDDMSQQSFYLRRTNSYLRQAQDGQAEVWFSPNTAATTKPADPTMPSDMLDVDLLIRQAKQAVFFLAFQPGNPNVLSSIAKAQANTPGLFVRGAVTNQDTADKFQEKIQLYHVNTSPEDVVVANPESDDLTAAQQEIKQKRPDCYSIIHDKIIVIDPLTDNPIVITGSHNLGYHASYNNDENLLIIKGNRQLAAAYMVHVMDVYDHYRWRNHKLQPGQDKWHSLDTTDKWQDRYFQAGILISPELKMWAGRQLVQINPIARHSLPDFS